MEMPRPGPGAVRIKKGPLRRPRTTSGYESPREEGARPSSAGAAEERRNSRDCNGNPNGGSDEKKKKTRKKKMKKKGHNNSNGNSSASGDGADIESGRRIGDGLNGATSEPAGTRWGRRVGLRDRVVCYRWTWFTMTMATGGVASVLYSIPFRPQWVTVIGVVFCILNLCLFVTNCVLITLRFSWMPGSFTHSFTDQVEALFVPAVFVSTGSIFINICEYGIPHMGPWLLHVMQALFWIYLGLVTLTSAGMYLILWSTLAFPIHDMTPIWVFPAYPLLLTAPFGSSLTAAAAASGQMGAIDAVAVALGAVVVQGTGFLISFMVSSAFLYRLMTQKLPRDAQRPGMFISIGPSGFTVAGIVSLGNQASQILPADFMGTTQSVAILRFLAYLVGLWLWGLSIWFFLVSVGSLWKYVFRENRSKMPFQMTWFSFVFPNSALATATEQIATAFDNAPLRYVSYVLACALVAVWLLVFGCMLRGLYRRQLLWPKDEEEEEREREEEEEEEGKEEEEEEEEGGGGSSS